MKCQFQRCGNIVYLSCTSKLHFCAKKCHWNVWGQKTPERPLHIGAPRPISNTRIPKPTPLTTPNDSMISPRTSIQLCNKVPIGNNGTPKIRSQNGRFPFDDHHPHLIHPSLDRPHSSSHFVTVHFPDQQTDTQTYRWYRRQVYSMSVCTRYIDITATREKQQDSQGNSLCTVSVIEISTSPELIATLPCEIWKFKITA